MKLEFKRLSEIDCSEYVALNTNPLVMRQMPLSDSDFDEEACRVWIAGKEKMWAEHGYGPWAFMIDGKFAGWGGLQPEEGDADLGLVLHPDYWGYGKVIYDEIIRRAFDIMGLTSVTILFPPTRTRGQRDPATGLSTGRGSGDRGRKIYPLSFTRAGAPGQVISPVSI